MVITGSALLIKPGSHETVLERLKDFPEVTFHVKSQSGLELVVNLEAEDHEALEQLCYRLRESIPEIVDIAHVYVNFEEEIEKIESGKIDKTMLRKPKFDR
ncbi:MAG: chaperone NapD [Desulfomonile tiedjei]|nr:chaperone NapD [Desulfomonile tiedjei]